MANVGVGPVHPGPRPQTIRRSDTSAATQFSEAQLPHKMNAVDDDDATIKGWRTVAGTLALGSLVLVAAVSWQPLTLLIDTVLQWPNFAMGWLSQVALVACVAGSCVMITTVASGHEPAVTRRFATAQYSLAAVIAAVSLVMFFAAGQQPEMAPQEYLKQHLVSSWLLPLLLYVPLALTTLVSWAAMRYSSR